MKIVQVDMTPAASSIHRTEVYQKESNCRFSIEIYPYPKQWTNKSIFKRFSSVIFGDTISGAKPLNRISTGVGNIGQKAKKESFSQRCGEYFVYYLIIFSVIFATDRPHDLHVKTALLMRSAKCPSAAGAAPKGWNYY